MSRQSEVPNHQNKNELAALHSRVAELEEALANQQREMAALRLHSERFNAVYEQLENEKRHYALLMHTSHDAIHLLDLEGNLVEWNDAFLVHLGYTAEESAGLNVADWDMHWEPGELMRQLRLLIKYPRTFETRHRRKDGSILEVEVSAGGFEQNGQSYLYASVRDITAHKRAEAALRESKERYRSVIASMSEGVLVYESGKGIVSCNTAAESILGLSASQALGKAPLDPRWHAVREDGSPLSPENFPWLITLAKGGPLNSVIMGVYLADGSLRWISVNTQPILLPGENHLAAVVATFSDITSQRRSLQQVRFQASLLAQVGQAVIATDLKGRYLYWNAFAEKIFGASPDGILGPVNPDQFNDDALLGQTFAIREKVLREGSWKGEILLRDRSGNPLELESTISLFRDENGQPAGYISVMDDIRERKRSEQALKNSEARLRAVLDSSGDAIGVHINGIWQICNPAAVRLFGVSSPEDLLGRPIIDVIAPAERGRIIEFVHSRTHGVNAPTAYVTRGLRADGSEFDMDVTLSDFTIDRQMFVLVILRDISERLRVDAALRESEELYHFMFDKTHAVKLLVNPDSGAIVRANQAAADFYGYPAAVLENMNISQINQLPPEQIQSEMSRAADESRFYFTFVHRLASGELRDVEVYSSPIELNGRRLLHSIIHDVTERKKAQAALVESESRFRHLADDAPVLVWMAGPDARCHYFNKTWLEFTGRTLEQELGSGWMEGVHPDDVQACLDLYLAAFKDRREYKSEYRLRRADGEYRSIIDNGVPRFTPDGVFLGYIGSCVDITERKRMEEALRDSENKLREVLENSLDASYKLDLSTNIYDYLNPTFARISGYTPAVMENLSFKTVSRAIHPDDLPEIERVLAMAMRGKEGVPFQVDFRFKHKDGQYRWFHDQFTIVHVAQGRASARIGSVSDITERKQAEEALKSAQSDLEQRVLERTADLQAANDELETLVRAMAHDLRTPLRAMAGYSHLLEENDTLQLDLESRHAVSRVKAGAKRMGQVIDDLMVYLHLRTQFVHRQDIDTRRMAQEVINHLQETLPGASRCAFSIGDLPHCSADPDLLRVVFANLIENAVKYTQPCREPLIELGFQDGAYFVRDNGIGFDLQYGQKIFDIFERLHRVDEFEGTGIGLAVVRRIIERHNGRVWADSTPGKGASFFIAL